MTGIKISFNRDRSIYYRMENHHRDTLDTRIREIIKICKEKRFVVIMVLFRSSPVRLAVSLIKPPGLTAWNFWFSSRRNNQLYTISKSTQLKLNFTTNFILAHTTSCLPNRFSFYQIYQKNRLRSLSHMLIVRWVHNR